MWKAGYHSVHNRIFPRIHKTQKSSIKYCWATSGVRWLNGEETSFSRTISVLVIRKFSHLESFPLHTKKSAWKVLLTNAAHCLLALNCNRHLVVYFGWGCSSLHWGHGMPQTKEQCTYTPQMAF